MSHDAVPQAELRRPLRERLYGLDAVQQGSAPELPLLAHSTTPGSDEGPLTFAQRRIWFYDQLYPGDPLYHGAEAHRIRGPIDEDALRIALDALVARQPSLRTRFPATGGVPRQVVARSARFALDVLEAPDVDAALDACVSAARRPFDLARDESLCRGVLIRLADEDHVLALVFHHAVWDGTSMGIVYDDLAALYDAARSGGRLRAPGALPVTYLDFARWQQDVFTPDARALQLRYWHRQLADVPALALRTDRPRPAERSRRGARVWHARLLDATEVSALRALARAEGATLFTALLATYAAVLRRDAMQNAFAIGFPVAGRIDPLLDRIVGCFINMLVLRTDFAGEPNFPELLRRVRDTLAEARRHQDVPFEDVVASLRRRPDLARAPIFDVMLNFRGIRTPLFALAGVDTEALRLDFGIANYDQTFELTETRDGLDARMQFNSDIYDALTIERLIERVGRLARAVAVTPGAPLGER